MQTLIKKKLISKFPEIRKIGNRKNNMNIVLFFEGSIKFSKLNIFGCGGRI